MSFRQEERVKHLKYNDNRYLKRRNDDPEIRAIWEDERLKVQVKIDDEWHTCIKGGY